MKKLMYLLRQALLSVKFGSVDKQLDQIERVVIETTGKHPDELRAFIATVPEGETFVERLAREQGGLSEQQKGALQLGEDMNQLLNKKGGRSV